MPHLHWKSHIDKVPTTKSHKHKTVPHSNYGLMYTLTHCVISYLETVGQIKFHAVLSKPERALRKCQSALQSMPLGFARLAMQLPGTAALRFPAGAFLVTVVKITNHSILVFVQGEGGGAGQF